MIIDLVYGNVGLFLVLGHGMNFNELNGIQMINFVFCFNWLNLENQATWVQTSFDFWLTQSNDTVIETISQKELGVTWDVDLYGELLKIGGGKER